MTAIETLRPDQATPAEFHRRLARWNARRLRPAVPHPDWGADVREDAEMLLLEGAWIEQVRLEAKDLLTGLPDETEGFIAWYEGLKGSGPGENDPLFPWLAETADLESMRWFLLQEVAGEAGFEDLVALAQVKMPDQPKLELARNYWDEMGRGHAKGMHGPMLGLLADSLDLNPVVEDTVWQSLALGNLLTAFSATRRYAYHALGALGVVELTAPWRAEHVAAGLKRLGVGPERKYYALHATLDVEHSRTWNAEVLRPLCEYGPAVRRSLAEGAVMRLMAGAATYEAYRNRLWSERDVRLTA